MLSSWGGGSGFAIVISVQGLPISTRPSASSRDSGCKCLHPLDDGRSTLGRPPGAPHLARHLGCPAIDDPPLDGCTVLAAPSAQRSKDRSAGGCGTMKPWHRRLSISSTPTRRSCTVRLEFAAPAS